jgi:hypothetical protein
VARPTEKTIRRLFAVSGNRCAFFVSAASLVIIPNCSSDTLGEDRIGPRIQHTSTGGIVLIEVKDYYTHFLEER